MRFSDEDRFQVEALGFVLVNSTDIDPGWVMEARYALEVEGLDVRRGAGTADPDRLDEGGAYRHRVVDAHGVRRWMPDLGRWYDAQPGPLSELFDRKVVASPYPRSAMTLKHYVEGDEQGWHFDTNPVSVLVYLSDVPAEGCLELDSDAAGGDSVQVAPSAGEVFVMTGRKLRHRVRRQPPGADRLTVACNYYFDDDTWRPEGIDDVVYGSPQLVEI